uniref:Uncharacterized protein n=1 Tax=Vitis vinifera TaxID=29760 RepID=A5B0T7_VITVI|nr:hypothetical protein VITISV_024671 [Vitis vinifera]
MTVLAVGSGRAGWVDTFRNVRKRRPVQTWACASVVGSGLCASLLVPKPRNLRCSTPECGYENKGSNTIKQIHLAQNRTNKKQELLMECLTKASQSTTLKVDLPSSGIDLGVIENQHSTFKIALLRYRSRCNRESTFYLQDSTT